MLPPAPKVTDEKSACSSCKESIVSKSTFSITKVLGGKNSKEIEGFLVFKIFEMLINTILHKLNFQ